MPDRIITAATAQALQEQAHDERGVLIWIVMQGDDDHPEKFAARPVQSGTGALHCVLVADTRWVNYAPSYHARSDGRRMRRGWWRFGIERA